LVAARNLAALSRDHPLHLSGNNRAELEDFSGSSGREELSSLSRPLDPKHGLTTKKKDKRPTGISAVEIVTAYFSIELRSYQIEKENSAHHLVLSQ
jgi:hypothetical protein